jgi:hypothetical protein
MAYDTTAPLSYYDVPEVIQVPQAHLQAAALVHQRVEAQKDKQAAQEEAKGEAERKRLLALKATEASSPYEVDARKIGELANQQINSKMLGDEPAHGKYGLQMTDIQNITKAQKGREDAQIKDIDNKTAQGFIPKGDYLTAYRNKVANSGFSNRDAVQDEHDNIIATKPHEVFSTDNTWRASVLTDKNFPVTPYKFDKTTEKGSTTYNTGAEMNSRFFIPTKEVEKDAQGNPIMVGGQPVYKPKPVTTIEEARELVPNLIGSKIPKDYVSLEASEVYSDPKNKQEIDEKVKEYENTADPVTGKPDANSVSIFKEGLKEKYAQEKIAERILNEQKAYQRLSSIKVSEKTEKPTEKEKEDASFQNKRKKSGSSGTLVPDVYLTRADGNKSEFNSQVGRATDMNRPNLLSIQKKKGNIMGDVDPQTVNFSGTVTDEVTGSKYKISDKNPVVVTNIYPVLEHYNEKTDKWVRTVFDKNQNHDDFENQIHAYGKKGVPIRVTMQGDVNMSTKNNKTGTLTTEESQEMATLAATKERDEEQTKRLGELQGKLAQEQGKTIRVNMEDSGIFKQVTGYNNMNEVAKHADTPEVKNAAKLNSKWINIANTYNKNKGHDIVAIDKKSEEIQKSKEDVKAKIEEFKRIKKDEGDAAAREYAESHGARKDSEGRYDFAKQEPSQPVKKKTEPMVGRKQGGQPVFNKGGKKLGE